MESTIDIRPSKDYVHETLTQTKTAITKLLDTVDNIDRRIYGKRMKLFIWSCILVLIGAPLLDSLFKTDMLTFISTLGFLIFVTILFLAFIGSWRDDAGNWSWKRAKSRLQTYYAISRDAAETTRTNSKDESLYKFGRFLFFGALSWKAFQNLSVFVRKPVEKLFGMHLMSMRHFERTTNHYYWWGLLLGAGIVYYLYRKNPQILERLKIEARQLFGWKESTNSTYRTEVVTIVSKAEGDLVINAKVEAHVNGILASSKSNLFSDFIKALQSWHPRTAHLEYEFQDSLYRHLRKHMQYAQIETEFPIGSAEHGNKGRADVVVNDTILIEMKRDGSAGAIQRAKGQVFQYSEIWNGKGPVILLLCDYEFEHAKTVYTPTMLDLTKLKRPALTIVAKPKSSTTIH